MENTSENKEIAKGKERVKRISLGILAHVDAGKTTLSEALLYLSGAIRKAGRVDNQDAFLDTYELEKKRGITIFSKQAQMEWKGSKITLLDTPGHVDFSAEMERVLQVLDYAVLVISGADGVQGHTRTLWKLLERYNIPAFLFVNKMDQAGTDREKLMNGLKTQLGEGFVDFGRDQNRETFLEELAVCDENVLEHYLQEGEVRSKEIRRMIRERKVFPCYFGSALKINGVEALLDGIAAYTEEKEYPGDFRAKVYKISRDSQGTRLTHTKVTGGKLKVKDLLDGMDQKEEPWEEKVDQIRLYSGEKYEMLQEAQAGMVCALTGLTHTWPGEGLGGEEDAEDPALEPVLEYKVQLPSGCDVHQMLQNLRRLEEEEPMLRVVWEEELGEIYVRLMGEVQIEILKSLIQERFGVNVTFDAGRVVYKETIQNTVEGVGHFEPLRHYAEVHLLMEPGERGSGLVFESACSEDELNLNWQRLILTHLGEKVHRGVLTGSAVTDMKITLMSGKAHLKHTEGGDFRQATYRAVRQGLMQAESILLEPYYEFLLEVPTEMTGRALTDIQNMGGECGLPEQEQEMTVLKGRAPVAAMREYPREVAAYTRGMGHLTCTFWGYDQCQSQEEVIKTAAYDPDRDEENPSGSVFCSHGAGYYVPWQEVPEHMHLPSCLGREPKGPEEGRTMERRKTAAWGAEEKELEEIFIRTYGKVERKRQDGWKRQVRSLDDGEKKKKDPAETEYLMVDGYNVIFAWEDLKELAKVNIEGARHKLMDVLCNYQGYRGCQVILVYDAYQVEGEHLEIMKYHNIHVVYTKEAETADQYIEKVVHQIGRKYHVTVVTSDGVEQVVTLGQGGTLISAREFREDVKIMEQQLREEYLERHGSSRNFLFDHLDEELAAHMEDVRLGRKDLEN